VTDIAPLVLHACAAVGTLTLDRAELEKIAVHDVDYFDDSV
jgi:hypothetical protein